MMKAILAATTGFAALTLVAGPAAATGREPASDAKPAARATPTADASTQKKYCIVDTITGSRLAQKVCKTRDAWMREDGFDPLNP